MGGDGRARRRRRRSRVEAERLGYHHLTCSEHVAIPRRGRGRPGRHATGTRSPTFGYLAARTTDDPLRDARARARLPPPARDREALRHARPRQRRPAGPRCRRRVARGGVRAARRAFDDRGARGDDAIRALRRVVRPDRTQLHGTHYDFDGFVVDPCALQTDVPIWIGGRTARSLRRAVELADGWAPFGLTLAELGAMLARARGTDAWASRPSAARRRAPERPSTRSARRPGRHPGRRRRGCATPVRRRATCGSCTTPSTTTASSSRRSCPSSMGGVDA